MAFDEKHFNNNDYLIRVSPEMIKERWSGNVTVDVVTSNYNTLNSSDDVAMLYMCRLMSSVIPMLEENEDFADIIQEFAKKLDNNKDGVLTVLGKDGNVVKLGFNSDTEGSA